MRQEGSSPGPLEGVTLPTPGFGPRETDFQLPASRTVRGSVPAVLSTRLWELVINTCPVSLGACWTWVGKEERLSWVLAVRGRQWCWEGL